MRVAQEYVRRRLQAVAPGALLTLFWEEFYRIYEPMVAGMVKHALAGRGDADDVIQEIWLAVAQGLPRFQWHENRGGFRAWVCRLIRNKVVDHLRRRCRQPTRPLDDAQGCTELLDFQADPALALEHSWRRHAIQAVVADLRPKIGPCNYAILHAHYWEEESAPAIAARLGLTLPQVKSRLQRTLKKVRARMAAYFGEKGARA